MEKSEFGICSKIHPKSCLLERFDLHDMTYQNKNGKVKADFNIGQMNIIFVQI